MSTVVAIGALGGSGTRVVAQVLIEAEIYIGDELNESHDNLIFTRLFKNPEWYKNASEKRINKRLAVFEEYMEKDCLSFNNAVELMVSANNNPTIKSNNLFYFNVIRKIINSKKERKIWGWKEPNTQIYIEEIANYFPNLKYIHVIRHGLDMAFSNNKQQLNNWGYKYDIFIEGNETEDEIAYKQLDYWIQSTKEVLEKCQKLGSNFLLLNHSSLCENPKNQIKIIIDFLNLEMDQQKLNTLSEIPKTPDTSGRYKKSNLEIFDKKQIEYVKEMGFEI